MNNKKLLPIMMAVMALVVLWDMVIIPWMYRHHPEWKRVNEQPATQQPATEPATTQALDGTQPATLEASATTQSASQPAMTAQTPPPENPTAAVSAPLLGSGFTPATNPAAAITIGSNQKSDTHPIGLDLTSRGAGINRVTLNQFKAKVGSEEPFAFQQPYDADPDKSRPLGTQELVVNGKQIDVGNIDWQLKAQSADSATYSLTLLNGAGIPCLRIDKTYALVPAADVDNGSGYEVSIAYSVANLSVVPMNVGMIFNGATQFPHENLRDIPYVVTALEDGGSVKVDPRAITEFEKHEPTTLTDKSLIWSGMSGAYFDAIVRVAPNHGGPAFPLDSVVAAALDPDNKEDNGDHLQIVTNFQTKELTVAAGSSQTLGLHVFFGPKMRSLLNNPYYSSFPRGYDQTLVLVNRHGFGWFCGICTFQWLVNVLFWVLYVLHIMLRDWGLAIIGLVLIVRAILHPITKRAQASMMRMQKLGPEMERLKKKYGDNKEELNHAMMGAYKEQGIAPILGCLPMFLQMPIWIALWNALQSTFELRQAPFLWNFTWIHDLSQPDMLIPFNHTLNFLFISISAINLLPLLMVIVTYFNQKYMPTPVASSKDQETTQKMTKWMSMFFPLFFYNLPSGLNLYYVTSMGLGIWESKIIRKHIKEQEEKEKAERVVVESRPTRASRQMAKDNKPAAKQGRLATWLAELQKKAEEAQKQAQSRKRRER